MSVQKIRELLNPYDVSPTECDGMTQICHIVLYNNDIPHDVQFGICQYRTQLIHSHYWIKLGNELEGWCVDYRLRMWLRGKDKYIPHGVFQIAQFPEIKYQGVTIAIEPMPEIIFQALLNDPRCLINPASLSGIEKAIAMCQVLSK